jgi:hypothetical protein
MWQIKQSGALRFWYCQCAALFVSLILLILIVSLASAVAQENQENLTETSWIDEIEKIFVPSDQCKQCHDRHYEEWKGMREQTPDLKTFGRVDGALLH